MIKLVKNDFFIYCKEARIESHRSFYGSFCLGPFEAGQSITIANALRRTLLSELKGLAITSAEIEGAFHEYSTLPGVKDSILDILLNFKDIVLKGIHFGNKKKGTSSAATFKTEQVGYLKTRGPGVVTASELKLPPGIQCVDPDQYIATLSEEGVLNVRFNINEGKNYVIQTYKNSFVNSYNYHINKGEQQLINSKATAENLFLNFPTLPTFWTKNSVSISLLPNSNIQDIKKEIYTKSSLLALVKQPFFEHQKRRLWLNKISLRSNLDRLKLYLKVNPNALNQKQQQGLPATSYFEALKDKPLFIERSTLKKLRLARIHKSWVNRGFVLNRDLLKNRKENSLTLKNNPLLRSLLASNSLVKKTNQEGGSPFRSGFQTDLKQKQDSFLYSGGAIAASKAVSLAIDAVFMPVNKVNYIIEINEQSVMAKEKNSAKTTSLLTPLYNIGEIFHHHPLYINRTLSHLLKKKQISLSHTNNLNLERNQRKTTQFTIQKAQGSNIKVKKSLPFEIQNLVNTPATKTIYSFPPLGNRFRTQSWFSKRDTSPNASLKQSVKLNKWLFQFKKKNSWRSQALKLYTLFLFCVPSFLYGIAKSEYKQTLSRPFVPFLFRSLHFMEVSWNKVRSGKQRLVGTKNKIPFFSDIQKKIKNQKRLSFRKDLAQENLYLKKPILKKRTRIYQNFLAISVPFFPWLLRTPQRGGAAGSRFSTKQYPLQKVRVENSFFNRLLNKKIAFFNLNGNVGLNAPNILNQQHSASILFPRFFSVEKRTVQEFLSATKTWPNSPKYFFNSPKKIKLGLQENNKAGEIPLNRRPPSLKTKETRKRDHICLSINQTSTALKNNINIEIWTNGSIHPRQALYEACKNLLSLFSKLEKATPLAVENIHL